MRPSYAGRVRQERATVTVVGAGIAGLVAARELVLLGHDVRVIDAAERVGGQLERIELDGSSLDLGADRFTPDPELLTYLDRLGLADQVVSARAGRFWMRTPAGQLAPLPESSWLGMPLAPLAEEVVALIGRGAAWRAQLDALLPGPVGARAATLGALVRRRFGDVLLEQLVAPVVLSERGVHPDALPVSEVDGLVHHLLRENSLSRAVVRVRLDGAVPGLLDRPIATLDGGAAVLVDALVAELERFGVPIERGVRVAEAAADHVVIADIDAADEHSDPALVRSDHVLVAAPGLVASATQSPPRGRAVAVLVVDTAAIPESLRVETARGGPALGVIAVDPAPGAAIRLDIVSAQWEPIGHAAKGRAVLRVHYRDAATARPVDKEQARLDAETLLGSRIPTDALRGAAVRSWSTASRLVDNSRVAVVGEQVVGADLARIVAHARATARALVPEDG